MWGGGDLGTKCVGTEWKILTIGIFTRLNVKWEADSSHPKMLIC